MKFVIERDNWLRGTGTNSCLLDDFGRRCCLGFFARACGLTDGQILNRPAPANVGFIADGVWDKIMFQQEGGRNYPYHHSNEAQGLMVINDGGISDEEKEKFIIETFAKMGIEVEFK